MVIKNKYEPGDIVLCIERERLSGRYYGNLYTVKRVSYDIHIEYVVCGNYDEKLRLPEQELELVCRKGNASGETQSGE